MPKAQAKSRTKAARRKPMEAKDPKASHLYTDDNPATTVPGTGFKDASAAQWTLELVSRRSLVYQFQVVNTMYNRAKHHPAMKRAAEGSASTSDMRAAMDVFRHWLDVTYPAQRDGLRAGGFKPLLSKKSVGRFVEEIVASKSVSEDAKNFARMYLDLPKGKRLGNVLVDESQPAEPDWERKRYDALDGLVPAGKESDVNTWKLHQLWNDDRSVSAEHLHLIAWAWSPAAESKLT